MNKEKLEAFAKEAAKSIKTPDDLNQFSQVLKKITVEAALNAEMDEHLGYQKHSKSTSSNSRNGKKQASASKQKMVNLSLIHPVTVKALLSRSLLKSINLDLPQWMIKFYGCMPKE